MDHVEVYADIWEDKKHEWLKYVKKDVLCTAFSYAWYSKAMEEVTGFGMKDCLSLPGLGQKYFNSLRTADDEPIFTCIDKQRGWFVRQGVKRRLVCALNQYYKSSIYDEFLKILSAELKVKGITYDNIEAYMNHKNDHFKNRKEIWW